MINVRLSEEEYLELERFCIASGARSISDLVRGTMHNLVASGNQGDSLASSVVEYSTHVKNLEQRVKDLAAELASFRTSAQQQIVQVPNAKDETAVTQLLANAETSSSSAMVKQLPFKTDS
jgi:phage shock protein A